MNGNHDRSIRLDRLTDKQREVLDLVLDRRTNKEIAHLLGISVSGVEQRLQSARQHLKAGSRAEAARTYEGLIITCGFATGGKNQVHPEASGDENPFRDAAGDPVLNLEDSSALVWPSQRNERCQPEGVLEMLDARYGVVGRIGMIVGLSAGIAVIVLTGLSIANALDKLI